jgi:hypothetical protein
MSSSSGCDLLFQARFEPPAYVEGLLVPQQDWFAPFGERACSVVPQSPFDRNARVEGSLLEYVNGSHVGSYGCRLCYDPLLPGGKPLVRMSSYVKFSGLPGEGACVAFGLCAPLDDGSGGEAVPNALIGLRLQDNAFVSYLSNRDGIFVNGARYVLGEWLHLEVVFDFANRVIRGHCNHELMGQIPFTNGITPIVSFVTMAVISNEGIPNSIAYFGDIEVVADVEIRHISPNGYKEPARRTDLNPFFALSRLGAQRSFEV